MLENLLLFWHQFVCLFWTCVYETLVHENHDPVMSKQYIKQRLEPAKHDEPFLHTLLL